MTDLKELEHIIFHKEELQTRVNLTLHKLDEFMEGEIFDEIVESLSLHSQELELKILNNEFNTNT